MNKVYYSSTCPTCCKPSDRPYRSHNSEGKIVQGCVDEFHTDRLIGISASSSWHNSKEAKEIRKSMKIMRNGCVTKDLMFRE